MLAAAIPDLPEPGSGRVEEEVLFELAPDLWVKVKPDWAARGEVLDLKTANSFRHRISKPRLRKDPAGVLYGLENVRSFGAKEVELRWLYLSRGAPYRTIATVVRLTRAELEDAAAPLVDEVRALLEAKAEAKPLVLMETNRRNCPRCFYRTECATVEDAATVAIGPDIVSDDRSSLSAIVGDMRAEAADAPTSLAGLLGDIQEATFGSKAKTTQGQGRKKKKKGRTWERPPASSRWTDLYRTREGTVADSLKVCQEHLGEVRRGETLHVISDGTWSMDEPIVHLAELAGPCDLYVATWSVSMVCALRLAEATRLGWLRELRLIIDDRIKVNRPEVLDVLTFATGAGNLGIMACHMKAYTLRSVDPDGPCYTLVGSANLNRNPRPEAVVIQEGREISDFYVEWIAKQLESRRALEYRSTHGPARRRARELLGLEAEEEDHGEENA